MGTSELSRTLDEMLSGREGGGRNPSMNWLPRRKICNTLTLFKLRKLDKVQQPCELVSRVSCTDLTLLLLSSLLD